MRKPGKADTLIAILAIVAIILIIYNVATPPVVEKVVEYGLVRMSSDKFLVTIDTDKGGIREIINPGDRYQTNFAGNEGNNNFIRDGVAKHLGEICIKYRPQGMKEWRRICLSEYHALRKGLSITVEPNHVVFTYDISTDLGGRSVKVLVVRKEFLIDSTGKFIWRFSIKNTHNIPMEIGEISIPLSFNLQCDSQEAYDNRVLIHPFISGHSSFIYLTRPNGKPPFLLVTPGDDTYFEAITGMWSLGHLWQPPPVLYLYAKANEDSWKEWFNGYSSLLLQPGVEKPFRIDFDWVQGYEEIPEKLYELGKVAVKKIIPGMVVPLDLEAYIVLKSKKTINDIYMDGDAQIELIKREGDQYVYKLKFNTIGEHVLRIKYGDKEWVNYPFYAIENIESLFRKRAKFIIQYQRITDPNDIRQYAFLMWDSENKTVLDSAPPLLDFGPGWPRPPRSWMNGCSDEIGFAEPLTLAIKNLYHPDEEEIKALEDYIWKFLYGKLQDPETFGVKRWIWDDPPPGYWRSFNYPHVFSIYYLMYLIAKNYPELVTRSPTEYLMLAYRTAMAFHSDSLVGSAWRVIGHMGQWTLLKILDALAEEGFKVEYTFLKVAITTTARYFVAVRYPYQSEFPFDTTGYETVYYYRKWMGRTDLANDTVDILLATLHHVPIWWWYGADIKGVGGYYTPLNARPLLDAFESIRPDYLLLRIGYAGLLAYLSQLHPTGEATTGPDWSPDGTWGHYFNSKWSNEYGIGLYPLMVGLKSYIVQDEDIGLVCFGCKVSETDNVYVIQPLDGVRTRVSILPLRASLEVVRGRINKLYITKSMEQVSLEIERAHSTVRNVMISIKGLGPGTYSVYVNGVHVESVLCEKETLNINIDVYSDISNVVITKIG
ncbi:MAG: DUF5695 domain-containing protein [Desulfurococcaceae archaeon]